MTLPPSESASGRALGVIVVQPDFRYAGETFLTTSACMVGTRWGSTASSMSASYNALFSDSARIVESSLPTMSLSTAPNWTQKPVLLSKQWAESLNPKTSTQNQTVADNLLRTLPVTDNICPENGSYPPYTSVELRPQNRPFMHEVLVASLVANGMSYAAGTTEEWMQASRDGKQVWVGAGQLPYESVYRSDPPGIVLTFNGFIAGYAWSLEGVPIKLALSVLTIYCVYTMVHLAYMFLTGHASLTFYHLGTHCSGDKFMSIKHFVVHERRNRSYGYIQIPCWCS